jgi:hypothetical protein
MRVLAGLLIGLFLGSALASYPGGTDGVIRDLGSTLQAYMP